MRAGARLGWRIATAVAFGATAVLAVTLSRGASVNAALASAKAADARHTTAGVPSAQTARCSAAALRISLGPGARVSAEITRYPVEFTNVSRAPCSLAGYPEVSLYRGDGVQVGAAAARVPSVAARIVLAPGQTAHAALDAAVPGAGCGPVRATGVRVVVPGQAAARFVGYPLTACTARAPRGRGYLQIRAVQAGAGTPVGTPVGTVAKAAASPVPGCLAPARSAGSTRSAAPARSVRFVRSAEPACPPPPAPRHGTGPD